MYFKMVARRSVNGDHESENNLAATNASYSILRAGAGANLGAEILYIGAEMGPGV